MFARIGNHLAKQLEGPKTSNCIKFDDIPVVKNSGHYHRPKFWELIFGGPKIVTSVFVDEDEFNGCFYVRYQYTRTHILPFKRWGEDYAESCFPGGDPYPSEYKTENDAKERAKKIRAQGVIY